VDAAQFVFSGVAVHRALQLLSEEMLVAEAVEGACRANRGAAVKVLVVAVVEAFVNAKLERTDASTAPYAAAAEAQGAAIVRRLSKRIHRAQTVALAEAAGATVEDMEFVALIFYSAMEGATRAVLEAGAPEDGGSFARRAASALSGIRGEVGACVRTNPDTICHNRWTAQLYCR
jgi:hypothetical protein